MGFTIIDPSAFLADGLFREDDFLARLDEHAWDQYRDRQVLVRGCGDVIFPPWAFMAITARLVGLARSVRYGNEHDNVTVYRRTTADSPHLT